ncbi:MAG: DUF1802 family protein [Verrucomicrobiae bacterium]|nr:DUF1802 family protein [Verrucomicrobiae bacterium]
MAQTCRTAFKEWAVVVDALGNGEQILILRKGGIHEQRGQFQVQHTRFWLYPTQYHEAEASVIPSKRPAVCALAKAADPDRVAIQFFAEVVETFWLTDLALCRRLQGRHVWTEHVVQQRFEFGRQRGLYAILVRVFAAPQPTWLPVRESYGGCKSWIELETDLPTDSLRPVLTDAEFAEQADAIRQILTAPHHGHAHTQVH